MICLIAGAKDLPRVARQLGLVTGRAVSYVSAVRKQALSIADETEISKASPATSVTHAWQILAGQEYVLRQDSPTLFR